MSQPPELQFEFVARYEVTVLDRIDRLPDLQRVLSFPDESEWTPNASSPTV